jgi:hypothetical protein
MTRMEMDTHHQSHESEWNESRNLALWRSSRAASTFWRRRRVIRSYGKIGDNPHSKMDWTTTLHGNLNA